MCASLDDSLTKNIIRHPTGTRKSQRNPKTSHIIPTILLADRRVAPLMIPLKGETEKGIEHE